MRLESVVEVIVEPNANLNVAGRMMRLRTAMPRDSRSPRVASADLDVRLVELAGRLSPVPLPRFEEEEHDVVTATVVGEE
jgi:hypothetical protein